MSYDDLDVNSGTSPASSSNAAIDENADAISSSHITEGQEQRSLADALRYEHPDYCAAAPKWRKYLDAYSGNDIYRFIHKHLRESDDMWEVRVKRGYYYNYVASVVDLYVSYLFHAAIARQGGVNEDLLSTFYDNADAKGTRYLLFMQNAATEAQICGHVGVLVDAPKVVEGAIQTEQDREDAGLRPYLTIVKPLQIKDWELDKDGKFEWVKIEIDRPSGRSWKSEVDDETCHYVIWTKTDWTEYELRGEEARVTDSAEHALGEIPLVIVQNSPDRDHPWFGVSSVRDITDINLALLNWSSLGDEEIAERCLNILTMECDDTSKSVTLSHNNVLQYMQGTAKPEYLQPGQTPLELIGKWIDRAKDEIYRLAKLGGSTGLLGVREATSGIAYAYEFNETNQSLSRKAEGLEQAEREIHTLYLKWLGKTFDGSIIYPRDFGVDDFTLELSILAQARETLTSPTAIRVLEKKLASKLFAREEQELRTTVDGEIDKAQPGLQLVGGVVPAPPLAEFAIPPPELLPTEAPREGSG
jgi:hypothetical protein